MSGSGEMPPAARQSRRRRAIICASFAVLVLLLLAAVAAIVLLAVLRPRDPTTELLSANATGAAPRVTFPTVSVQLNVTFLLVVRLRNPNPASFRYGEAATTLLYRGAPVGSAVVPAGTVPSRGATTMRLGMTVQADKVVAAAGIGGLLGDVLAGEMEFEARTDVKGRVTFLGFVKRNAQGRSACRIAIGVPDVKVRRQECHNEARL
ncbi:hypothetical protein CFC21_003108 [Triticum aestivum]|uniref:Late embryogenesis abundant protein LEA-2 subgroup domain-containing protein n=2 Tax=Triticum TaxID=4564 RepID=A0A9R0UXM2_TRITD|nr:uncharacterized protein LOC123159621 [Triticum aestivum]XP_048555572.1 uncharacterized protein LOC125536399 [Triticum urartu]KAF6985216.1 hypothetical protein CFC21_003108 [Triticum aestivum]VAH08555.1 unnamed protein product [Triticum turgidum subsp. durum]